MLQYIFPAKHNSVWKYLLIISFGIAVFMLGITGCASNEDYDRLEEQVAQLQSEINELRRTISGSVEASYAARVVHDEDMEAHRKLLMPLANQLAEGSALYAIEVMFSHTNFCHKDSFMSSAQGCIEFETRLEQIKARGTK